MAIKELFYDQRPIALLDPRASQRIDPRFKFTRSSAATSVDSTGLIRYVGANTPRVWHDPTSKDVKGLLLEPLKTNRISHSANFTTGWSDDGAALTANTTETTAPDGTNTATKFSTGGTGNRRILLFTGGTLQTETISLFVKPAAGTQHFEITPIGAMEGVNGSIGSAWSIGVNFATGAAYRKFYIQASQDYVSYDSSDITLTPYPNGWYRLAWTYEQQTTGPTSSYFYIAVPPYAPTTGFTYGAVYIWGSQLEAGTLSSYIPTTGIAATREPDLLSVNSLSIPSPGSVFVDTQALSTNLNSTLLSLKNASNQKINLVMEQRSETYNSLALINTYSGTAKSSLPLPVPTTNRERNIITWGANNYQYTKDSSRFAPSLSTSVPANLTSLSIGHDSVDPTKAFNGYINSVYLYNGEIAPAIAEALVRGELNPVNADTYSPSGPAGSLALVINTQGASASGDKVFALPAESAANNNDLVITWGDGTESALELAAAEVGAAGLSHTYPSAGIYPVWVAGKMQNLYFNNSASAPDLLSIASWGTGQMFTSPSTMAYAFYGCSKLTSIASSGLPNTSAVTSWYRAFRGCSSLTSIPSFNFSGATSLREAFTGCSSITSFPAVANQTQNVTNFAGAWADCSSLTSFPLINTSAGLDINSAWANCSLLTSFPLINTSACLNLIATWFGCSGLTTFPLINTANCTTFNYTWYGCTSLTSFPLLNSGSVTDFRLAWYACSNLTSFPLINTANGTRFDQAWYACVSLTSFPAIDTGKATSLDLAWYNCYSLTSFPLINTASCTSFYGTWYNCVYITSFPLINTAAGTDFSYAWRGCATLTSFPLINTAAGTNFTSAWRGCGLTSFPQLVFDNSVVGTAADSVNVETGFLNTWSGCTSLANFPANMFNTVTNCTRYLGAFQNCALTAASIENIIVSINAAGTSNGNLSLQGGTNAGASTWTANAVTAYNALVARGWTITRNA